MVAKTRPSLVAGTEERKPETVYQCGTLGVWMGRDFIGNLGCQGKFIFNSFDVHAHLCFACSRSMCAEFQVPRDSSGACEVAIRSLHRFNAMLTGFDGLGRYEAVRMIVLASGADINAPTEREKKGADHIAKKLEKAKEFEIGQVPEAPRRKGFEKRIPPALEGVFGARLAAGSVA